MYLLNNSPKNIWTKRIDLRNKRPGGRRKLNMQKSSVQDTVHIENLKFLNTANQMKDMWKEGQ